MEGGSAHAGENFDLVIAFALSGVIVGGGLTAFRPLLPLLDSGPSAEGKEVPGCQHGLESLTVWVLEGYNKGGG